MFQKYRSDILFWLLVIATLIATYYLQEILLPFFIGIFLAFASKNLIYKIQKWIKNRNLAVSTYLLSLFIVFSSILVLFSAYINHDANRLTTAFKTFASNHEQQIDDASQKVADFIASYYNPEEIQSFVQQKKDSLQEVIDKGAFDYSQLDTDAIKESLVSVFSFFQSSNETVQKEVEKPSASLIVIIFSSLFYFVYILFYLDYFTEKWDNYVTTKSHGIVTVMSEDLNNSFVKYFKLRSRIVLVLFIAYLIGFSIMGIPGAIIFALLAGFLAYIPYLQYFTLIPLSLSCLVLTMETQNSFFIYFGIIVGFFVLMSILEEIVLIPNIMEANIGMNPVIMILAVSVWTYIFGLFGVLIAIPLTSLMITYVKRFVFENSK